MTSVLFFHKSLPDLRNKYSWSCTCCPCSSDCRGGQRSFERKELENSKWLFSVVLIRNTYFLRRRFLLNKSIKNKKKFPFAQQIQFYIKKQNVLPGKTLCFFLKNISDIIKLLAYVKLLNFSKHANRWISYLW